MNGVKGLDVRDKEKKDSLYQTLSNVQPLYTILT
jgi:hypothetical protein